MATDQQMTLYWNDQAQAYPLPEVFSGSGVALEPSCGDRLEIRLAVTPQGIVSAAGFSLSESACAPIRAAASYACHLCLGKSVFAASLLSTQKLAGALTVDGVPDVEHVHCLMMAELALKRAVADYASAFKKI